ncbi:MAG TPA: tRNA lysidine(34) synthetase TilS [Vicinamibacterales bacterium]
MADTRTRVLIALSGGSDSVALAHIAHELAGGGELQVAGVAHFNHQLRHTALRDEQFCGALAARLGWPIIVEREDVAGRARREGRSLEDAAHVARHAFFQRARAECRAEVVALGHTQDDQAETFLMRLLRGAGARGLASMHPRNGSIVRPLLDCRRSELRGYLAERDIPFVDDETNSDSAMARNRVRAELLPILEARFNPNIIETLATEADLARDEWLWMTEAAAALRGDISATVPSDGQVAVTLELDRLAAAPPALARMLVWNAMIEAAGGRSISYDHVAAALRLMKSERGGFDAPGQRVERIGSRLVLTSRPAGTVGRWTPSKQTTPFEYPLSIPGDVVLPEAGCAISAEAGGRDRASSAIVGSRAAADRDVAFVRGDLCNGALVVRNRRPGDYFRPVGGGRRKKLQDFFVDTKVSRSGRDAVPIVVDGEGRIVWVAGHAIDTAFRVTDPAQGVLILRLRRV